MKDFIAIQVVTCLDDFTGQMLVTTIRKYKNINFTFENYKKEVKESEYNTAQ